MRQDLAFWQFKEVFKPLVPRTLEERAGSYTLVDQLQHDGLKTRQ